MNTFPDFWPLPQRRVFEGEFVSLTPLDAARDAPNSSLLVMERRKLNRYGITCRMARFQARK